MKKSFTGPSWFLLVFGLLMVLAAALALKRYIIYLHPVEHPAYVALLALRLFAIPLLSLVEARIYWALRRDNIFYGASWAHCFGVLIAYLLPVLLAIPVILHYRRPLGASQSLGASRNPYQYMFWIIIIAAHAFFISVVIQCRSLRRIRKAASANSENLLDDVLP